MYNQDFLIIIFKVAAYVLVIGIGIIFCIKMGQTGSRWGLKLREHIKKQDEEQQAQDDNTLDEYHV